MKKAQGGLSVGVVSNPGVDGCCLRDFDGDGALSYSV